MALPENVDFEFEREGNEVTISARALNCNFTLTFTLDGAAAFAASATRVSEGSSESDRIRFQVRRAQLECSK